jgi:hypothetical protein
MSMYFMVDHDPVLIRQFLKFKDKWHHFDTTLAEWEEDEYARGWVFGHEERQAGEPEFLAVTHLEQEFWGDRSNHLMPERFANLFLDRRRKGLHAAYRAEESPP